MRIIIATQDFPPDIGGTQTYASELAARWMDTASVAVVAPQVAGSDAYDHQQPFPIARVPGGHNRFAWNARTQLGQLRRAHPESVVFCVQWTAALAALLGGWRRNRIVLAVHGRELLFNPLPSPFQWLYSGLRRAVLRRVHRIVAVSRYTAGLVRDIGVDPDVVCVVPNGTDHERFSPVDARVLRNEIAPSGGPLLLTVSRLVPRKGTDILIKALPAVLEQFPSATLAIVGIGPERERLGRLARTAGVREHVRFMGAVEFDRLPEHFSAADVFVMAPRTMPPDVEGFGLVFLEANACGIPVIGSRSGGIEDAIQEGITGILVEPDDIGGLAGAIVKLLADPDLRATMGREGRAFTQGEGSWHRAANALRAELSRLIET